MENDTFVWAGRAEDLPIKWLWMGNVEDDPLPLYRWEELMMTPLICVGGES